MLILGFKLGLNSSKMRCKLDNWVQRGLCAPTTNSQFNVCDVESYLHNLG